MLRPIERLHWPSSLRTGARLRSILVASATILVAFGTATSVGTAATPNVDSLAPDFALRSSDGTNLRLSEFRGDVVMLNFWTRSCGRCREQLEQLDELNRAFGDSGLTVLSIAITDDPHHVDSIVRSLGLSFPVLYDDQKVAARLYEPASIPLTLLIDPHGNVRYVHRKYRRGDEKTYREELQTLLSE